MIRRTVLLAAALAPLVAVSLGPGDDPTRIAAPDRDLYRPTLVKTPEGLLLAALAYDGSGDEALSWTAADGRWLGPEVCARDAYDRWASSGEGVREEWSGTYADGNYELSVQRGHAGADLAPTVVQVGAQRALVWTNSYFPTRTNGDLTAVGYDRWADKVYRVAWSATASFGEGLEVRLTSNMRGETTVSDRAYPIAGEEDGEVWIVYGELVGSRAVGKSWRLMLCRVDPSGASAPVPLDDGRLGPLDQVGVLRHEGRVWVARTVHEVEGRKPAHSELAVFSFTGADLPPRRPLAARVSEPRRLAADGLDLANDGRDERPLVEQGRRQLHPYFGNLHLHSDLSRDGRGYEGSPEMNFRVTRDVAQLDFAMLSDHVEAFAFTDWWELRKATDAANEPGSFVTLPGYEWTSPKYGHKNVVFPDTKVADDSVLFAAVDEEGEHTPDELWAHLGRRQAITIPHHPSHGVSEPTDWSFRNDHLQRLVEIFQVRGNYEYEGAPYQKRETRAPWAEGHTVRDALAMGHRLGIIASPDHGGGFGLAGVWAGELTRESVFEALHARRTFGTTGAKMSLYLRVNDSPQGGEITSIPPRPVRVEGFVSATADGLELTLVSDGEELWTRTFEGREASFEWTDERPLEKTRYVYLRATQGDGHIGWTSPVWVNPAE